MEASPVLTSTCIRRPSARRDPGSAPGFSQGLALAGLALAVAALSGSAASAEPAPVPGLARADSSRFALVLSRSSGAPAPAAAGGLAARAALPSVLAAVKPAHNINPEEYAGSDTCATCHDEIAQKVARTVHGAAKMPARINKALWGCEGCHGPGKEHAESGGDPSKIVRLSQLSPEARAETCLGCHGGQDDRINFRRSEHQASQVACDSCHSPHGEVTHDRLLRQEPNALCFSCHNEKRNDFALPFHHKVPEGAMQCIDCHNQHGGFSQQQRLFGTDRACLKCHTDKQGPFTFEHLALRLEGCTGCHLPHGSNNPRLLTRSEMRFVCLECHSQIVSPGEEFPTVGTPSFHNLTQDRYKSCTTCHVMIHGSNISNVFFE